MISQPKKWEALPTRSPIRSALQSFHAVVFLWTPTRQHHHRSHVTRSEIYSLSIQTSTCHTHYSGAQRLSNRWVIRSPLLLHMSVRQGGGSSKRRLYLVPATLHFN